MPDPAWIAVAEAAAKKHGVPMALMGATVEGESDGKNIAGDFSHGVPIAFGYGQIVPKWHVDEIRQAAQECGKPDPGTDPEALAQFLLKNPDCSMTATALVIKNYWEEADGDFNVFLDKYVGPKQPAKDRERRWAIYRRWLAKEGQ